MKTVSSRVARVAFQFVSDIPLYKVADMKVTAPYLAICGGMGNTGSESMEYTRVLYELSHKYKQVFLVPGGAEMAAGAATIAASVARGVIPCALLKDATAPIRGIAEPFDNVHVLCRDMIKVEGIRVLGVTLFPRIPESIAHKFESYVQDRSDAGEPHIAPTIDSQNRLCDGDVRWISSQMVAASVTNDAMLVLSRFPPTCEMLPYGMPSHTVRLGSSNVLDLIGLDCATNTAPQAWLCGSTPVCRSLVTKQAILVASNTYGMPGYTPELICNISVLK